ncbi:hypothetical protein GGR58DRAFT_496630 [Xylaria digitata]|nr:hypothetical protein GGR58DRAFT_496630 [Xylaria digitata]
MARMITTAEEYGFSARGGVDWSTVEPFALDNQTAESKVGEGEEKIWEEADENWMDVKGIDWFKPYFATWIPRIPDEEIQDLWD